MTHSENHHIMLHKMLHDRMTKIYLFQSILTFVKSLIGIFVPIYLYSIGFGFEYILLYGIGVSISFLLAVPLSVRIIHKLGFKYTILLSLPLYLVHLTTLNYINDYSWMYYLTWFTFGIFNGIFWPCMHSEIAVSGNNKHRGSQIGTLQILIALVATIAPMIGGFTLEYFGYWELMILSSVLLIISTIPLIFSEDIRLPKYNFNYKDYIRLMKSKKHSSSKRAFLFEGIEHSLSLMIWPLILYIVLQNFATLGILFTIISIFSVIILVYIKKQIDMHRKERILRVISNVFSTGWFARSIIITVGSFVMYFIEGILKLVVDVFRLTFNSIFYNNAKNSQFLDYIILREAMLHTTRIVFMSFLILIVAYFGDSIKVLSYIVLMGIIGTVGMSFIKEE